MSGLLDCLAAKYGTYISNLRLIPALRIVSIRVLYRLTDKEKWPLPEWTEAVSYLTGSAVSFDDYDELTVYLELLNLEANGTIKSFSSTTDILLCAER